MSEVKKVICTQPKDYKLTKDKVYEVIKEKNKFYLLKNDGELPFLYAITLFKDYQTDEEIKKEFLENFKRHEDNGRFKSIIPCLDDKVVSVDSCLSYRRLAISCGIREISGINSLVAYAKSLVNQVKDGYNSDQELVKEVVKLMVKEYINIQSAGLIMFSTNTNHEDNEDINPDYDVLDDVLNQFSQHGELVFNPNSDNYIKLWTVVVDNTNNPHYFEIDD